VTECQATSNHASLVHDGVDNILMQVIIHISVHCEIAVVGRAQCDMTQWDMAGDEQASISPASLGRGSS
jgi:hypothetical protein